MGPKQNKIKIKGKIRQKREHKGTANVLFYGVKNNNNNNNN